MSATGMTTVAPALIARSKASSISLTMQHQGEGLRRLEREALLGERVAQHQRGAVEVDMHMHGAALLVRRIAADDLRAEGLDVEFRGLHRAVDLKIGHDSTQGFGHRLLRFAHL